MALGRPEPEQIVGLVGQEPRVDDRPAACAEGVDQAALDRDGRSRVGHLERRAGAHEVVLHVDDEERRVGDPLGGSELGRDDRLGRCAHGSQS